MKGYIAATAPVTAGDPGAEACGSPGMDQHVVRVIQEGGGTMVKAFAEDTDMRDT